MKPFFYLSLLLFLNTGKYSPHTQKEPLKEQYVNLAQTKYRLYEGTLNTTSNISLYINEQEHPCGGNQSIITAMYKYNSQNKWILLHVTTDEKKANFCFVENKFTGVLFLKKKDEKFTGKWVSPNTQKQFKVELQQKSIDKQKKDVLEAILFDDLVYNNNDC